MDAQEQRMERAVAALMPFVDQWDLSLNPEDLYEIAHAVLSHAEGGEPTESELRKIDAAVREQLAEYKESTEDFQRKTYGPE